MTRSHFILAAALLAPPAVGVAQDTTATRAQAHRAADSDSTAASPPDSITQTQPAAQSHPCAVGKVLESCRQNMLHTALEDLLGNLKDPFSAKLDPQIVVTREEVPVVCGRVNAKNSYGGYTGMSVFVYSLLLTLGHVVFPSPEQDAWKKDLTAKALKRCTEAGSNDFMAVPAEYRKYVEE